MRLLWDSQTVFSPTGYQQSIALPKDLDVLLTKLMQLLTSAEGFLLISRANKMDFLSSQIPTHAGQTSDLLQQSISLTRSWLLCPSPFPRSKEEGKKDNEQTNRQLYNQQQQHKNNPLSISSPELSLDLKTYLGIKLLTDLD